MSYLALAKAALTRLRSASAEPASAAQLLEMPLDVFAGASQSIEIRVPWFEVTLWFVPTEAAAERLTQEDVTRGRIWTARELMDLLTIEGLTDEQVRTVALAKLTFGGDVVEGRRL